MTRIRNPWLDRIDGGLWIDGESIPGTGTAIDVIDPSTGELLGTVADADVDHATLATSAAAEAMPSWSTTPPRERAEVLRRCFDLMTESIDDLADLVSLENGKALADARAEIAYAAEFFRWYAEEAVRISGSLTTAPAGQNKIMVLQQPVGVAALVTPWNFPAAMATRKIAPALAAGCGVVLKPASSTPLTAFAIAQLMSQAGVPDGLVNVVTTRSSGSVVSQLLHDPRVRALSFTGSTSVGRSLLIEAADQVLVCSMELGGNAPVVVLDDADLDTALPGILQAKMRNGGQACTAANRILVHHSLHDELADRLAQAMGSLQVGPGREPTTECGPMIDDRAVAKAHALVTQAVAEGARLVVGGAPLERPGSYYPPTVVANTAAISPLAAEEVFAPVATLIPFDDDDHAVALANATEFGLAGYVFSSDLARALALAERLDVGMVGVNRGVVSDPAAPFGGVKQSGLGREGSVDGIEEFLEKKYIAVSW
ncbi:NAD-dependent succinate-semialdehyde dehydrogenase [Ruania alba]|uniref:Succinate semialdehyde dehydrogenase n=1 Tax=Ruania alba TaxID=648782 RepID=A0A1H5BFV3_9MICO|nr:NAD-dependent succinate-semialdehyde dehydrogenase [Ruania alba]SED52850.1 succinate semialdehyde dehydrogenase [Ruania alba]